MKILQQVSLVVPVVIGLMASGMMADVTFFFTNTEAGIVEFVNSHPDIDYSTYRLDGCYTGSTFTLVDFAASRDYTQVLAVVESLGAVAGFNVPENLSTPLEYALTVGASTSVRYLARVRPDWLQRSFSIDGPPLIQEVIGNDTAMAQLLIEEGAHINATDYLGRTVTDIAGRKSPEMLDLLRSHGGLFRTGVAGEPSIAANVRSSLVARCGNAVINVYSNRFVLPSEQIIEYSYTNDWVSYRPVPLSSNQQLTLYNEIIALASNGNGTVVVRYHEKSESGFLGYISPLLRSNGIFGLYVPADGVTYRLRHENVFPVVDF